MPHGGLPEIIYRKMQQRSHFWESFRVTNADPEAAGLLCSAGLLERLHDLWQHLRTGPLSNIENGNAEDDIRTKVGVSWGM